MGKILLVMLPNMLLILSIIMQTGQVQGTAQSVCFSISTSATCTQNGSGAVFTCPVVNLTVNGGLLTSCKVSNSCTPIIQGAFCWLGAQYIWPGQTVTVQAAQVQGQGIFNFGSLGVEAIIPWIGVAVGVAVLAGLTILSTGLSSASIRIMFTCGLLLAVFGTLAALEGFLSTPQNPNSFFVQLNTNLTIAGVSLGAGTLIFFGMALMEGIGIITYTSLGGDE